jgi:hypothetical protein
VANRIWWFRFPDGQSEMRTFPEPMVVGDELELNRATWVVSRLRSNVVTLERKTPTHGEDDRAHGEVTGHEQTDGAT